MQPQPQPQPQPYYQPQPPQPYSPPPQYDYGNPGFCNACNGLGNSIAATAGRLTRYIVCPWSIVGCLANHCDGGDDDGSSYGPSYGPPSGPYGGNYYQPQPQYYQPPQQPQYFQPPPQPQFFAPPQQPQGQWYSQVVPIQQTQNQVLQPSNPSLIPDYGLPNGYGAATC